MHEATIAMVAAEIAKLPEDDRVLWLRFISGAQVLESALTLGYVRWDRWGMEWLDVYYASFDSFLVCFGDVHNPVIVAAKSVLGVVIIDLLRKHWLPMLKTP